MKKTLEVLLVMAMISTMTLAETAAVVQSAAPPQNPAQSSSQSSTQSTQNPSTQNPSSATTQTPAQTSTSQSAMPNSDQPASSATSTQNPQVTQRPSSTGTTTSPAVAGQVASGTEMHVTLDSRLTTDTSKVGDGFTATVAEPVRDGAGNIVIPAGSKVQGEVTEVEQGKTLGTIRGAKAKLNMRFTQVQLPSGSNLPLTATLVSVNSTNNKAQSAGNEGEVNGGTTATNTAKDVGIGAAVGTVAGLIFGSALKGLAIGAVAGGGYVLATGGKNVDLPQNTGLVLRVDQPIAASPAQ